MSMPPVWETIVKGRRTRRYPKGQVLFHQDDAPLDVFVLKEGRVKVYDTDEQGSEKILQILKPWAVMPLAFFSGPQTTTQWAYAALTDCEVYPIPAADLMALMRAQSDVALYLMNWFSQEVHELLVRLSSLSKTNARDKMIAALRFLVAHHGIQQPGSNWWRIAFPVNHQLLANMTGITRESATATMKMLQDARVSRAPRQTVLEVNADRLK